MIRTNRALASHSLQQCHRSLTRLGAAEREEAPRRRVWLRAHISAKFLSYKYQSWSFVERPRLEMLHTNEKGRNIIIDAWTPYLPA